MGRPLGSCRVVGEPSIGDESAGEGLLVLFPTLSIGPAILALSEEEGLVMAEASESRYALAGPCTRLVG